MMPEWLSFESVRPYVKKQEIDFRSFEKAGLFLIHGKTGAGKTTVLDAMTYALLERAAAVDEGISLPCEAILRQTGRIRRWILSFSTNGRQYRFYTRSPRSDQAEMGEKRTPTFAKCFFQKRCRRI